MVDAVTFTGTTPAADLAPLLQGQGVNTTAQDDRTDNANKTAEGIDQGVGILNEFLRIMPNATTQQISQYLGLGNSTYQSINSLTKIEGTIGQLVSARDGMIAQGRSTVEIDKSLEQARGQLDQSIAGMIGVGFSALGVFGGSDPTLSKISQIGGVGVKTYNAVQGIESAISSLRSAKSAGNAAAISAAGRGLAQSILGGVGAGFAILGLFAGNNQTLQTISQVGGLAVSAAMMIMTGPTPLAVIGLIMGIASLFGLFGGKPKTTKLTDKMDVTGDGSNDLVKWHLKDWNYLYSTSASDSGLKMKNFSFSLHNPTMQMQIDSDSGEYYSSNRPARSGDDEYGQRGKTEDRYYLSLDVGFEALFAGITNESGAGKRFSVNSDSESGTTISEGIELSKEQYDALLKAFGEKGEFSNNAAGKEAFEKFRPFLGELGTVGFEQTAAAHGMNFYLDVNQDGNLDRVQQFMDLSKVDGPDYKGEPDYTVNFRDANGREYRVTKGDDLNAISQQAMLEPYALAYVASHEDLMAKYGGDLMGNMDAIMTDFMENGLKRGLTFEPDGYLLANPDLMNKYGADTRAAIIHYIQHGRAEGRETWTDSVDKLMAHSRIATAPGEYLKTLAKWIPGIGNLFKGVDMATVTPTAAAEFTRSLLKVAPQAAGYIVKALLGLDPAKMDAGAQAMQSGSGRAYTDADVQAFRDEMSQIMNDLRAAAEILPTRIQLMKQIMSGEGGSQTQTQSRQTQQPTPAYMQFGLGEEILGMFFGMLTTNR